MKTQEKGMIMLTEMPVNPTEFGIEMVKATEIMGNLPQIKEERSSMEKQYDEIIRLDIENKETSKRARELRLKIKDNRTKGIEVWHKTSKEYFLKGGQFVDAIKKLEIAINTRMEDNLEEIEKHFEIQEEKRKAELNTTRLAVLKQFEEFVPIGLKFGEMTLDEFAKVFRGARMQHEYKMEQEKKAEEARILKEKAESEERKRIEIENKKLKEEAEKKEKEFAKERAKVEAERKLMEAYAAKIKADADEKLRKEREENEKLRAKIEAEENIKAEVAKKAADTLKAEQQASIEAAKAPIKQQLLSWVDAFLIPEISLKHEKQTLIQDKFESFKNWAKKEINTI